MRTIFVTLLASLVLGGAALAQDSGWAGVSAGYPGVSAHVGIADVGLEGLSVRVNLGYDYVEPTGLALGADLLYGLPVDTGDIPGALYLGVGGMTIPSTSFTVHGIAGVEVALMDLGLNLADVSLFAEGGVNYGIDVYDTEDGDEGATGVGFLARAGVNYHFDF